MPETNPLELLAKTFGYTAEQVHNAYNFGFEPSESQYSFFEACMNPNWKEVVLDAGRNWGKDLMLGMYCYDKCMNNPYTTILFVTPYFKQIKNFFRQVMKGYNKKNKRHFMPQGLPKMGKTFTTNWSDYEIKFENGSLIKGVSTDNPDGIPSLRSDIIILNECALLSEDTIQLQILPIINKDEFKMIYVSTPRGKNHFYHKFVEGIKDETSPYYDVLEAKDDVISFKYTYLDNPKSGLAVDELRRNMPRRIFLQEVMGEFLDDSSVFAGLDKAIFGIGKVEKDLNYWTTEPEAGKYYAAGADLAKDPDWTVLIIIEILTGKIVHFERFNGIEYNTIASILLNRCAKFNNALLRYDATGGGVPFVNMINALNKNVHQTCDPFVFSSVSKPEIINSLALRVERESEWIPGIPVLLNEMRNLECQINKLGKYSYAAPSGKHDDTVMALALANSCIEEQRGNIALMEYTKKQLK